MECKSKPNAIEFSKKGSFARTNFFYKLNRLSLGKKTSVPDWAIELILAVSMIIIWSQVILGNVSVADALMVTAIMFIIAFILRSLMFYVLLMTNKILKK